MANVVVSAVNTIFGGGNKEQPNKAAHNPLTLSDDQILEEIYSTHVHSDAKFDVNSLFSVVDNIVERSTRIADNVVQVRTHIYALNLLFILSLISFMLYIYYG